MKIRHNSRAFMIHEKNEILLQKFEFRFTGKLKILWVTPGGGVEEGESFEQALGEFHDWLPDDCVVLTWSNTDLYTLADNCYSFLETFYSSNDSKKIDMFNFKAICFK